MKTQFGSIIVDGRGSLSGHSLIKSRQGINLRTNGQQNKKCSKSQATIRQNVQTVSRSWSRLSVSQQFAWANFGSYLSKNDVFGKKHSMTGFNAYRMCNLSLLAIGQAVVNAPPNQQVINALQTLYFTPSIADSTFKLYFSPTVPEGFTLKVYATRPLSAGVSYVDNQFKVVALLQEGSVTDYDIFNDYMSVYGTLGSLEQVIFVKAVLVSNTSGLESYYRLGTFGQDPKTAWLTATLESYVARNAHIPSVYMNTKILPFLQTELVKPYYYANFSSSTVADWLMTFELNGYQYQIIWQTRLELERLRWVVGDTVYNQNSIGGFTYNGMVLVTSPSHFDELRSIALEYQMGGGGIQRNMITGYLPWHEHPKTEAFYLGFTSVTGAFPMSSLPECWHLCLNSSPYTSLPLITDHKLSYIFLGLTSLNQEFPAIQAPLLEDFYCHETDLFGALPFAGQVLEHLDMYFAYNCNFSSGFDTLDLSNATQIRVFGNPIGGTMPIKTWANDLTYLGLDTMGFTGYSAQTYPASLPFITIRSNALPVAAVDQFIRDIYKNGAFTSGTYRINLGSNATPSVAVRPYINTMRLAGCTILCNGY